MAKKAAKKDGRPGGTADVTIAVTVDLNAKPATLARRGDACRSGMPGRREGDGSAPRLGSSQKG